MSVPHLSKEFLLVLLRECQEKKKLPQSCGHHALGDLTMLSTLRDHVSKMGPGMMVSLQNQDGQGVGKLASFLGEGTQALLGTVY